MPTCVDLVGKRYGRLLVVEMFGKNSGGGILWLCLCECNKYKTVSSAELNANRVRSCGCLLKETAALTIIINSKKSAIKRQKSFTVNGQRNCSFCNRILPLSEFCKRKKSPGGIGTKCKECCRFGQLKYKYNIEKEEFFSLLIEQNYTCPICDKELKPLIKDKKYEIVVDHCHTSGKVRGLLPNVCNSHYVAGNDITPAKNVIAYLEKFETCGPSRTTTETQV